MAGFYRFLIAGASALAMCSAQAQTVACNPASPLAITGTSNAAGKWAAWRCPTRINIVACTTDHCTDAVINAAWWVWDRGLSLSDANSALKKYNAGDNIHINAAGNAAMATAVITAVTPYLLGGDQ